MRVATNVLDHTGFGKLPRAMIGLHGQLISVEVMMTIDQNTLHATSRLDRFQLVVLARFNTTVIIGLESMHLLLDAVFT